MENAIRHGLAPKAGPGLLTITAERDDGWLSVRVADDGVGMNESRPSELGQNSGVGLRNARSRLIQMYGDNHRFEIQSEPYHGTTAHVRIPFSKDRRSSEAGNAASD